MYVKIIKMFKFVHIINVNVNKVQSSFYTHPSAHIDEVGEEG